MNARWLRRQRLPALLGIGTTACTYWLLRWTPEVWPDAAYGAKADDVHWKLGMATGSATLVLLAVTLSITPIRALRGAHRNPVHLPMRRAFGVWSAVGATIHAALGVTIHADGWALLGPFRTALDAQGTGRLLGLALVVGTATLGLEVTLASISNDRSLHRVGPVRWKRIQRLAYLAGLGALVHVLGIQIWERRYVPHVLLVLAVPAAVIGIRLAASRSQGGDQGADARSRPR